MLRIKRSVQAKFSTDVSFIASQAVARSQQAVEQGGAETNGEVADTMAQLERQAKAPAGFVAATDTAPKVPAKPLEEAPTHNPDAIDLDME